MREELKTPDVVLDRVLAGLARELAEAGDDEIAQAAHDLGMDVKMKGSAAFIGVTSGLPKRIEDFFDGDALRAAYEAFLRERRALPKTGKDDDEQH